MKTWSFGKNKELAQKLQRLVLDGVKTATTGLFFDVQSIPAVGEVATIIDSDDNAVCAIEYTSIEVKPFMDVAFDFVVKEGEGYKNVEEWRKSHRDFFRAEYPNKFKEDSQVVCEEFKVAEVFQV